MSTPAASAGPAVRAVQPAPAPAAQPPAAMPATAAMPARDRDLAAAAPYLADWEAFRRELPPDEPAALVALRRAAIERFAILGFPTTRQEEWRFTSLAPLAREVFQRAPSPALAPRPGPADLAPWIFEAAARLVFVDGRFAPELSTGDGTVLAPDAPASPGAPGILVASLAGALAREPRRLESHLGRHTPFQDRPFVALNTAFLRDGAVVLAPRGAVVERPIHLLYLSTAGAAPMVSYPRNLIVAGEGSQLTVVETYVGEGVYFSCGVTELIAGAGAVVDHYKVQRESREAYHLATLQVHGERDSAISSHSVSLGGSLVRNDVNALLDGEGINCILNGLYLAEDRQVVDNHMRVEHAKPHCASHELYKGILDGKARSVFNGLIHVHPGAQKTDAKQSNRNLLLSADAIANSNPRLEIFADDVKCTHGSTVGQLDDDAVFYLRSRGIGEAAARSLLTYAFASDVLARIKVEPVRRDLEEFLFARLPQGDVVRQAV
ncbi:MAG TPA: Fe-S cluster assembly protein SufD [Thermoanaerobaculia bacterium]|nr:Fe-S cluster assembly protein SufD [Thermoanaerobaculia bacterium]